jgi:isoleucyl-tRNA synthetase
MITHSFPHCWRTNTPLIFRATPQWFISMSEKGLLDAAQKACDSVQWVPGWGRARIDAMLASSPDWCISRQRTWGVPITLFVHRQSQELHPDSVALIDQVAQKIALKGIEAWFELDPADLLGDDADAYEKVTDTLDVWFDSGVTHYSVLQQRADLQNPADLYLEGSDQHRGWFQSSLKTAIAMYGKPPYRAVLTHGFTVDAEGKKMSKSAGNIVAPQSVMNELGADVLRLWVAATDFSSEMSVSDEILKRVADSYRRIRNTARFLLSNLEGFDPAQHLLPADDLLLLDRWIISRAAELQQTIVDAYNEYQFHLVYQKVHNFCVVELGGIYLDIIKDRQYTTRSDSIARRSAQTALFHIAEAMCRWLAPILSFTAEELWSYLPGEHSDTVLTETWYDGLFPLQHDESMNMAFWHSVLQARSAVSNQLEGLRKDKKIGSSLDAEVTLYCNGELQQSLQQLGDELRFVFITSEADIKHIDEADADSIQAEVGDATVQISASASQHVKCTRCWHHRDDVGSNSAHPELCGRCVENVDGDGEPRSFA